MERTSAGTLWAAYKRSLDTNSERPALRVGDTIHSYSELDAAVANAVARLRNAGVMRGQPVVLLTEIGASFPVYDLAVMAVGAIKIPVNPDLTEDEIGAVAERVDAAAAVVSDSLRPLTTSIPASTVVIADTVDWERVEPTPGDNDCDPEDPAVVYFTGGTTGKPKGIVHSQAGVVTNLWAHILEGGFSRDEQVLVTTPLVHAAGLFTLTTLLRGGCVRIESQFDANTVLDIFDEDSITWTFAVPTMIYRMLDAAAERDWRPTALRTIQYGGAPISVPRLSQALEVFGPVLQQLYGQTEVPNYGTLLRKEDHVRANSGADHLLRSCGRASLMCDVAIYGEDGEQLPNDETGEICLRAPYSMSSYWDDPEGFAERFHGDWLRTGDVGYQDDEGNVYIVDRRADMIVTGGMNVYSLEVEQKLAKAPGVASVAVIGVPHDDWGESVHAVVVGELDEEELKVYARANLASYKRPKSYEFRPELPLTTYGKIDRKELRAPFWAATGRQVN
jgi:fatty-acyl-CoA synthase